MCEATSDRQGPSATKNASLSKQQKEKRVAPKSNIFNKPNRTHLQATAGILSDSVLSKIRELSQTISYMAVMVFWFSIPGIESHVQVLIEPSFLAQL